MQLDIEIDKLMDYEFRKKLYELDEIGFIGIQGAKETEKKLSYSGFKKDVERT